jgi:hypothetical protein
LLALATKSEVCVIVYCVDAIELTTRNEVLVTDVKLKVSQLKFGLIAKGGGSLLCHTVLVSNVPANKLEKDIRKHLTTIGGQIERYQPVPYSSRCLVTFTDYKGIVMVLCLLLHSSILFGVNRFVLLSYYENCELVSVILNFQTGQFYHFF